jgi:hypothetical protein
LVSPEKMFEKRRGQLGPMRFELPPSALLSSAARMNRDSGWGQGGADGHLLDGADQAALGEDAGDEAGGAGA